MSSLSQRMKEPTTSRNNEKETDSILNGDVLRKNKQADSSMPSSIHRARRKERAKTIIRHDGRNHGKIEEKMKEAPTSPFCGEMMESIPNLEEMQADMDDLPSTPRMTRELYDIMYPELPTMQELDEALEKFQKLKESKSKSAPLKNITVAAWNNGPQPSSPLSSPPKLQGKVDEKWFVDTLSFEASKSRNNL